MAERCKEGADEEGGLESPGLGGVLHLMGKHWLLWTSTETMLKHHALKPEGGAAAIFQVHNLYLTTNGTSAAI